MSDNRPSADVVVDDVLVRRLITSQHPDLAGLPIVEFANGWDNVMFRLGEDLVVRVPRRELAGRLVANEVAALPQIAPELPIAVPVPVRVGQPDDGYPYVWAVLPWFDGDRVGTRPLRNGEPGRLGSFLGQLHRPAPADAPDNPYRGHFIGENDDRFRERLAASAATIEALTPFTVAELTARWETLIEVDPMASEPVWLHGDLHALNILQLGGAVSAVIDWGDVTSGDPAVDLAVAWMLFDAPEREELRAAAGADESAWQRAEAWALYFAVMYLSFSADDPALRSVAVSLAGRLAESM